MTARIRLLLAVLTLVLVPFLVPGHAMAAPPAMAMSCDGSCDHAVDGHAATSCAEDCLTHISLPVLLAPLGQLTAPAAVAVRTCAPAFDRGTSASWPPPLRPPCA